ncbi:MAG: hypothetical protein ACHQF2_10725 [Flavobacteriales bacterium]
MELSAITTIPKEDVAGLRFPSDDVISSDLAKKERMTKLFLATKLGNLEHGKIRIYFTDENGPKVVETTIWATGDKSVILKRGMTIPIHRITDVRFH